VHSNYYPDLILVQGVAVIDVMKMRHGDLFATIAALAS
jgi:hypothetical protein